ncbi:MAG: peptidase C69 [Rhodothalassiaceae bacterium]|nr:MAG: peptidase C69 [Rhodothalassiaceae bacterium]
MDASRQDADRGSPPAGDVEALLYGEGDLDAEALPALVGEALTGLEDGELFAEYARTESLLLEDGRITDAHYGESRGFGLRGLIGEQAAFAHSPLLTKQALAEAAAVVRSLRRGGPVRMAPPPPGTNRRLYGDEDVLARPGFAEKVALLAEIDRHLRSRDPRVRQVTASLAASWRVVEILRADGFRARDIRPLVRLTISVVLERDGRRERGSASAGGRLAFAGALEQAGGWRRLADEALRQADVNLAAEPMPAGEMPVVLGPGWPGVLLHEAVGHGLEGDFNRKGLSVFAGRIGERVAAPGVTVVDDGTIPLRRGSLTIDDEGTPSRETVLIEDGVLKGYLFDRLNARLMGRESTGNGRRQSYAHLPMPRMTNTFMRPGDAELADMIAEVKDGIYAVDFGGGQVDITSGRFVFTCTEAYRIRNGRIAEPVKGATLIGSGAEVLQRVRAIGRELRLDPGIGTCGKDGQSVPVGVGQPALLVSSLVVGGTEAA